MKLFTLVPAALLTSAVLMGSLTFAPAASAAEYAFTATNTTRE